MRDARSAVEHRPADVVTQPLVVEDELANCLRELVALPSALESPCDNAVSLRNVSTHGLDRVGSCTELVRGHVCDGRGLARSVRGKPRRPSQISGRAHCLPTRRASLHHLDFATHPRPSMLYRLARSRVVGASRLEAIEDVLRTGCRPQGQEPVVRICEGSATADCGEARIANPGEDHMRAPLVASDQPNLIDAPDDELQIVTLGEGVEHGVVERGAVYRFEAPATPRLAYA